MHIISQPESSITPELVNQWFYKLRKYETPIHAKLFKKAGEECGVNWLGLWCMAMVETGYFTSKIFREKGNMFGLGAVDSDPHGGAASFVTPQEAVLAGAQHLAVYAGVPSFKLKPEEKFILKRTSDIRKWGYFGLIKEFKDLGGKNTEGKVLWASNPNHGKSVEFLIAEILATAPKEPESPKPPEAPPAVPKGILRAVVLALWPVVLKFFPWLGWLTAIVYALVDLFLK